MRIHVELSDRLKERGINVTPEDLITTGEVAHMTGLTEGTLATYRRMLRGPRFHRIRRKVLYSRADVVEYAENMNLRPYFETVETHDSGFSGPGRGEDGTPPPQAA